MGYYIGLDLGTSSTKGMLCDESGKQVSFVSRVHNQASGHLGRQEQDADSVWYAEAVDVVRSLMVQSSVTANEIVRIGLTGCVPAMILIDAHGNILRPAILHTDTRAQQELDDACSAGLNIHHGNLLPKLLWVQRNETCCFRAAASVLVPHTYLVYRFTGVKVCDNDSASVYGGIFDNQGLVWKYETLSSLGIPHYMMPQLRGATEIAGNLLPEAAQTLGLTEGTEVIVGTGDSFSTLLGTGVTKAGELMLYWGTSGTRVYTLRSPLEYLDGPHFFHTKARFIGKFFSCGESIQHMRRLLGNQSYVELDRLAEQLKSTEGLWYIPQKKQQLLASSQAQASHIIGLQSFHSSAHIYRAVLESIAFASIEALILMEKQPEIIYLCGGGARSRIAREAAAALAPCPVWYSPESEASKGIALLACLAGNKKEAHMQIMELWRSTSRHELVDFHGLDPDCYREKLAQFRKLSKIISSA